MCEQHQASHRLLPLRETPLRAQQVPFIQNILLSICGSSLKKNRKPTVHNEYKTTTRGKTNIFILTNFCFWCINRTNPIGMRGHMAKCYGDLVMELWSGTQKNVAPLKLRVRSCSISHILVTKRVSCAGGCRRPQNIKVIVWDCLR